jgi:stage V sporulation protein B
MSKGQQNFVKGAAILGLAGLFVKVIGAIFRIPLTIIIGTEGMASYSVAYPIYAALVVLSTAGLPTAISRMVSERVSVGDFRGAHKVFQKAFKVLLLIGIISTVVMLALAGPVANGAKIPEARLSLMMIAPALLFVSLLSAYRGYFQGLQQMFPTALTQIVEQLIKLGAGLFFAWLWWTPEAPHLGAAGALLGVSLSEVVALLLIIILYNRKKGDIKQKRRMLPNTEFHAKRSILMDLLVIALPIAVGGCIMPLVSTADTFIINNQMAGLDYSAFNPLSAKTNYSILTNIVNPLVNMPAVLSLALCMSLVPAISEARALKNQAMVSSRSAMGFKLGLLIGLPCAVGMFLLSEPIINLLYASDNITAVEIAVGGELLRILAIGVLFLTMLQTMTGILQGSGHQFVPLINLGIGAVVKVVLSIVLIRVPSLNINGAAIGTAACYGIAAVLNVIAVARLTKPDIRFFSGFMMPLLSTAAMGLVVYFMYGSLSPSLGNTKATMFCILAAVLVYVTMLFFTGSLKKTDMEYIPGGGRIIGFMNKLGFWRQ